MFIAPDLLSFKTHFATGLKNMLTTDGLGALILVLANSMQDPELFELLQDDLRRNFDELQDRQTTGPEDDLSVFTALTTTGIQQFSGWEHHALEPWELVVNPLRSLRPARVSSEVFKDIHQPFAPDKFHFNKPFLRPEILWEGDWHGSPLRVLYNKFPFAPWHLLVVPEPAQTLPQFLSQTHHARMMTLVAEQASVLPGLGMAFNSLGAYASINQLHFQGFVRETRLPVELPRWQHRGGDEAYPLECWHTASTQDAWQMIESLHQAKQPYNLLYRADGCYILPRKGQGRVELPNWAQGIAWHEACGVFTLAERHMLEGTGAEISQQLGKLHHQG